MIKLAAQRKTGALDLFQVGDESVRRSRHAAQHDLDAKGVAVHAAIFVSARHAPEAVRGVEPELVADFHHGRGRGPLARAGSHGMPISLWICSESRQRGRRRQ